MPNLTTTYKFNKPLVNNATDADLWGAQLNTNWDEADQEFGADFVDVASATTTDIGGAASRNVRITGTTTITGFGTVNAGYTRRVRFADALTLTHNGTSLILPGAANITTAANDCLVAVSLGSGNWIVTSYEAADTTPGEAGLQAYYDSRIKTFESTAQTITSGGGLTIAHGLGGKPDFVTCYLKCTTTDGPWNVGDEFFPLTSGASTRTGFVCERDSTNLVIRFSDETSVFNVPNRSNGGGDALVNSSWEIYFKAVRYI